VSVVVHPSRDEGLNLLVHAASVRPTLPNREPPSAEMSRANQSLPSRRPSDPDGVGLPEPDTAQAVAPRR
jgi:hypothetical protein